MVVIVEHCFGCALIKVALTMHLMYYMDENGKRIYTLKVSLVSVSEIHYHFLFSDHAEARSTP